MRRRVHVNFESEESTDRWLVSYADFITLLFAFFVVGGTLGATLLQTTLPTFWRSLVIVRWVFISPKVNLNETIEKIINWSQLSRREGLLALEKISDEEDDLFSQKGLQMLVDGNEPEMIRGVMETEINTM